jgi:nifR3 family TIM-barrel protein
MVSVRGITDDDSDAYRFAVFDSDEQPLAIQLVAAHHATAGQAAAILQRLHPAMFNINAGCPNDRICEVGAGASLVDNISTLSMIISAVVKSTPIPVSVKVRARGHSTLTSVEHIARTVEDAGAVMLIVHARGRFTQYAEAAQWDEIARAKAVVSIPVVGDGDIFSSHDARAMKEQTGCDGVMIARGTLGTPWIFRDIELGRDCGILDHAPAAEEMLALVLGHCRAMVRQFGPIAAVPRIRKHIMWYVRHYRDISVLREAIFHTESTSAIDTAVMQFFESEPERMAADSQQFRDIESAFRSRVLYWTTQAAIAG